MRSLRLGLVLAVLLLVFGGAAGAQELETLRIGYLPILVMEQHFVATDQGWYDELGVPVEATRFSSGPPVIQAFAAGELDVAYVGIEPALVMVSRGVPVKVVAANVVDGLTVLGSDAFAALWAQTPSAEAFAAFEEANGRKLRVATLPQGSTPDTVLRLWLSQLGLTPDAVEILPLGVEQVQAALATGEADASVIMEPVITLAQEQGWGYQPIVWADEILDQQPGATLVVSQALIDNHPELVEQLVEIHVRATNFANENLDEAARIASEAIGEDILPVEVAQEAVRSRATRWISDPHQIIDSTQFYNEFQVELGIFTEPVPIENVFDTSFYDAVIEAHPEWAALASGVEATAEATE